MHIKHLITHKVCFKILNAIFSCWKNKKVPNLIKKLNWFILTSNNLYYRFKEFEDKENCSKRLANFLRFLERDNKEEINKYLANLHRGGIYPGLLNRALTRIIAKCDAAVADCNKFVDVINTINNGGDISNLPAPKF